MCLMNNVLNKYLDRFILVFIDDILVYSKSEEEHKEHLRIVLQTLKENQLYAKFSKCEFYKDKIQYLGHIISEQGLAIDPQNIKAIREWSVPNDVSAVRSFMGIAGYYRGFVERFSAIAYPITSLQIKGVKFEWIEKFQNSFEQLKLKLTIAPILKIADPDKEFIVCTDACREGLGGVLLQENFVIAYESRKLKTHEQNYSAYYLELAAIIHPLKICRHYLLGNKFTLMTDHISLKYFFSQTDLNA